MYKMLENGCILYKEQCRFICKASCLSLISLFYAIHREYYGMTIVPGGVFLTSINYWRNPDYSWRRTVDIFYVKTSLFFNIFVAYHTDRFYAYLSIISISILFYLIGIEYYKRKMYWRSTYCHSMLHVIANIANIVLYSGNIPNIQTIYNHYNN